MTSTSVSLFALDRDAAKDHMLKSSSYFDLNLPEWFDFEPVLRRASELCDHIEDSTIHKWNARHHSNVNYQFLSNKDGKLSWRPFELINPLIYAKSVQVLTKDENWNLVKARFAKFSGGVVECCSLPVVSTSEKSDTAEQILQW